MTTPPLAPEGSPREPAASDAPASAPPAGGSGLGAALIGAGIFSSRFIGLVRERLLATYFGAGLHADVFGAALRLPNVLQNLLGEGTLSASFIPTYSALLGQGRLKEAGRVAGAVFALLLAVAGAIALAGIALAPVLVTIFTPGFTGQRRELMIGVVRVLFPMTGLLVLSAWALGILNSHRRFFLPYFAPVLWNAAIIAALVGFASRLDLDGLLFAAAWGALLGGFLQFAVQLPAVRRLDREIALNVHGGPGFKEVVAKAGPAILGRGVVQLSTYVDMLLASLLAIGAVARLRYAQTLYVLPVSLFGMSIAAAELPELARARGDATGAVRERTVAAVRRLAFYVVPSAVAFVLIGDLLVAGLYRAGRFTAGDVRVVWLVLIGYSLGLVASTTTRVYQSAFFALRDTTTPARVAGLRVLAAVVAGSLLMTQFEPVSVLGSTIPAGLFGNLRAEGLPLGPLGLALGGALGAWVEWGLLRARLKAQIGRVDAGAALVAKLFGAALVGAALGRGAAAPLADRPLAAAVVAAGVFGASYLGVAWLAGFAEARAFVAAARKRFR
jgi:putative peptidoglycan lipid II flippase